MDLLVSYLGGALIGLAAAALFLGNGRIAGVSGVAGRLFEPAQAERAWRYAFLLGLVAGGAAFAWWRPGAFSAPTARLGWLLPAGFLIGLGTQAANGCTSGHGICGIGRGSLRSIVATLSFMAAAIVTVFVMQKLGGAS